MEKHNPPYARVRQLLEALRDAREAGLAAAGRDNNGAAAAEAPPPLIPLF